MVYTSRESKLIFLPINPYSYENLLISLGNEDWKTHLNSVARITLLHSLSEQSKKYFFLLLLKPMRSANSLKPRIMSAN